MCDGTLFQPNKQLVTTERPNNLCSGVASLLTGYTFCLWPACGGKQSAGQRQKQQLDDACGHRVLPIITTCNYRGRHYFDILWWWLVFILIKCMKHSLNLFACVLVLFYCPYSPSIWLTLAPAFSSFPFLLTFLVIRAANNYQILSSIFIRTTHFIISIMIISSNIIISSSLGSLSITPSSLRVRIECCQVFGFRQPVPIGATCV